MMCDAALCKRLVKNSPNHYIYKDIFLKTHKLNRFQVKKNSS